jgi:hypothetical protein
MAKLVVVATLSAMFGALAGAACDLHAQTEDDLVLARDHVDDLLDCLSWQESRDDPSAYNRRSGAAGQFQFMFSTWMTTPQGRAGLSRYDAWAARSAARWMIGQGRLREWSTWGLCA